MDHKDKFLFKRYCEIADYALKNCNLAAVLCAKFDRYCLTCFEIPTNPNR